jgi:serine protease Do
MSVSTRLGRGHPHRSGRISRASGITCALLAWATSSGLAAPELLELRGGATVRGEILAERPDRLVVDLGYTVISVPREEIERRGPDTAAVDGVAGGSSSGATEAEEAAASAAAAGLFQTVRNPAALPVQAQVERVGGAVVLVQTPTGLGSGFIIHPDGFVVTNHHVVAGENELSVTRFVRDGAGLERVRHLKIRIVAQDPRADLALLRIEDAPAGLALPTVPIGDSQGLGEGQAVFAIGSPLGLDRTVSQGIVSSKNRLLDGQLYIQTTTQINPGNSGGPLFNLRGEVVGVNNMKAMMVGIEGLNFAIPATTLKNFLRHRDAFAFDPRSPNAGFRYLAPPRPVTAASAPASEPQP